MIHFDPTHSWILLVSSFLQKNAPINPLASFFNRFIILGFWFHFHPLHQKESTNYSSIFYVLIPINISASKDPLKYKYPDASSSSPLQSHPKSTFSIESLTEPLPIKHSQSASFLD